MRQRAALARTLCEDRPVVLMDEPFAHLDAVTRLELQDLAARLLAGRTAVLVTHDPLEALRVGHQIRVLSGTPFIAGPAIEPAGRGAARSGRPGLARPARAPRRRAAGPRAMRPLITALGLLLGWEVLVWATGVPSYILPPPSRVLAVLVERSDLLLGEAAWTAAEMVIGLALGLILGAALAIVFAASAGMAALGAAAGDRLAGHPRDRHRAAAGACGWATAWPRRWRWRRW